MSISSKTSRLNSQGLQACVLLCAMLVLPLGPTVHNNAGKNADVAQW